MTWRDLPDRELEAQLRQKRCTPNLIEVLVRRREDPWYGEIIEEELAR